MYTLRRSISGLLTLLLLATAAPCAHAACERMVVTSDPAYPPLHWYDGQTLQGASIEIAKRVLDDLKIPYEIRFVGPFPRVLLLARHGDVDMVATLKQTPERDAFLLFPPTPALSNPVSVFTQAGSSFPFHDRADLEGRRGGITRGNKFGAPLDNFIEERLRIEEANSPENSFDKLALGRIDYFITGYYTGMAILLKRGDEARFAARAPYLAETANYLALTKEGKCRDKLELIDARLAVLKKNGVIDDIVRKSFQTWKNRPVLADR
jgi:polar amino acid transport system substrate-binding protein